METHSLDKTFLEQAVLKTQNMKFVLNKKTTNGGETDYPNIVDNGQMIHDLYSNKQVMSEHFSFYKTVFDDLDILVKEILRMKINITFPLINYYEHNHQIPHYDVNNTQATPNIKFKSFLVYLNNSDGDTFFFKNNKIDKRIKYEKGKGILFDSNLLHAGQNPIKHNMRLVLNTIFISGD